MQKGKRILPFGENTCKTAGFVVRYKGIIDSGRDSAVCPESGLGRKKGDGMFGYVRPLVAELKVGEYRYYKSVYCGICKAMGGECGSLSRAFLS